MRVKLKAVVAGHRNRRLHPVVTYHRAVFPTLIGAFPIRIHIPFLTEVTKLLYILRSSHRHSTWSHHRRDDNWIWWSSFLHRLPASKFHFPDNRKDEDYFILGKQLISRILRRTSPTDIEINERFPILPTVKTRLSIFIFHRICSLCHRVRAHTISRLFHIDVYFIINTSLIQDNRFSRFRVIRQFCIILRIKAKTDRSKSVFCGKKKISVPAALL